MRAPHDPGNIIAYPPLLLVLFLPHHRIRLYKNREVDVVSLPPGGQPLRCCPQPGVSGRWCRCGGLKRRGRGGLLPARAAALRAMGNAADAARGAIRHAETAAPASRRRFMPAYSAGRCFLPEAAAYRPDMARYRHCKFHSGVAEGAGGGRRPPCRRQPQSRQIRPRTLHADAHGIAACAA